MADEAEERQAVDQVIAVTLGRMDERLLTVVERLDGIDKKLVIANGLRVQMAALEARGKYTYAFLTLIVGGLISLAFKVLSG